MKPYQQTIFWKELPQAMQKSFLALDEGKDSAHFFSLAVEGFKRAKPRPRDISRISLVWLDYLKENPSPSSDAVESILDWFHQFPSERLWICQSKFAQSEHAGVSVARTLILQQQLLKKIEHDEDTGDSPSPAFKNLWKIYYQEASYALEKSHFNLEQLVGPILSYGDMEVRSFLSELAQEEPPEKAQFSMHPQTLHALQACMEGFECIHALHTLHSLQQHFDYATLFTTLEGMLRQQLALRHTPASAFNLEDLGLTFD